MGDEGRFKAGGRLRTHGHRRGAPRHSNSGGDGTDMDIQSVVTHEVGHLLGLGHTTDQTCTPLPTMAKGSYACGSCETQTENLDRRTLERSSAAWPP
jgi:hypothetical protein